MRILLAGTLLLASHALAAPAAPEIRHLGCITVTAAEVDVWAKRTDAPRENVWNNVQAQKLVAREVEGFAIKSKPEAIDEMLAAARDAKHVDDAGFDRELARSGWTRTEFRAYLDRQLGDHALFGKLAAGSVPLEKLDEYRTLLLERVFERMRSVPTEVRDGHCSERWPAYDLAHVRITGLAAADEPKLRAIAAEVLHGDTIRLGPFGLLSTALQDALEQYYKNRGRKVVVALPREEPGTGLVQLTVQPAPR